jgi:hypothetical protein
VIASEDGPGQVIKIPPATPAVIPLARRSGINAPTFLQVPELAIGTLHPVRPTQVADSFIAFVIVNQLSEADYEDSMQMLASLSKTFQENELFSPPKPELSQNFFNPLVFSPACGAFINEGGKWPLARGKQLLGGNAHDRSKSSESH